MTCRARIGLVVVSSILVLLLAACVQEIPDPTPKPISARDVIATVKPEAAGKDGGGATSGAQLFQTAGCQGCHQIDGQGGAVGPDLSNIGTVAETRVPGMDAQTYIRTSIVQPNEFIVQGYQAGVMPATYEQSLTPEQIDALVNYLLEQQ